MALQRSVRRQQALARKPPEDLVWQPRFAYGSALIILFALTVISLPLWIVLYRITGASGAGGPAGRRSRGALHDAARRLPHQRRPVGHHHRDARPGADGGHVGEDRRARGDVAPASPEIPGLDTPLDNRAS